MYSIIVVLVIPLIYKMIAYYNYSCTCNKIIVYIKMIDFIYSIVFLCPITDEIQEQLDFYSEQERDTKYEEIINCDDPKYQNPFIVVKMMSLL